MNKLATPAEMLEDLICKNNPLLDHISSGAILGLIYMAEQEGQIEKAACDQQTA